MFHYVNFTLSMNTVIVDTPIKTIIIRKSHPDAYDYYALILQHNATGQIYVINVPNDTTDPHYFKFTIDMEGKLYGEYTYYVVGNNPGWSININTDNIYDSCYTEGVVYLGGIDSLVFAYVDNDLAISDGTGDDCLGLDFLGSCTLQYYTFENNINNSCYIYNQYECCKGE